MAIQPIDLQTLFTQVDKVGKTQTAQRESLAIQQAIEGVQIQRKTEEQIQSVNKAQDTGEGVDKVNDRREQKQGQSKGDKKSPENNGAGTADGADTAATAENKSAVSIRDLSLGRTIDISL